MKTLSYPEILKLNNELGKSVKVKPYRISVISNITIHQIKEIIECSLRIENINAIVEIGDYDNIIQDSTKVADSNAVIIFWELCNIVEGLNYKIEQFEEDQINEIAEKICLEIGLTLKNLESSSLVIVNNFSSVIFPYLCKTQSNFDNLANILNKHLSNVAPKNVKLIDVNKVLCQIGIHKSIDLRYYFSSKALYTIDFFKEYSRFVKPLIMSANGKSKKAIIFDCDNTLWKGILGEDGFENIDMSAHSKSGIIFHEIQSLALALNKQGILLGLCSKNNLSDIEEVIRNHPDMLIREEYITIKKINWTDKATNIRQIAKELNIGLDSIVFVDDSPFEINLIKEQLPEVKVLQVPEKLYEYPQMLRSNLGLFYNLSLTKEDLVKSQIYKQQSKREELKSCFSNVEEYLSSLELKIHVFEDDSSLIPRLAQMTQKTNQFNLTTQRYTETDIEIFVNSDTSKVFAWSVSDKFGDNGITGLCIIKLNDKNAEIDTFLMSCRIIGRNIEFSVMDFLIDHLNKIDIDSITAKYLQTAKNAQVADFYKKCSFKILHENEKESKFSLELKNYKNKNINYIKLENGNKN